MRTNTHGTQDLTVTAVIGGAFGALILAACPAKAQSAGSEIEVPFVEPSFLVATDRGMGPVLIDRTPGPRERAGAGSGPRTIATVPDSAGRAPGPTAPARPAHDWTGLHLGLHAGEESMTISGATRALQGPTNAAAARESADLEMKAAVWGFQAGYDYQLANGVVVGIEADFSEAGLRDSIVTLSPNPALAAGGNAEAVTHYDVDWTAGLRVRLGYAISDRLLVYGTGGVALAREDQAREQYISNSGSRSYPLGTSTIPFFVERVQVTREGVSGGLGAEYALGGRWSIRGEYVYSNFGDHNFDFPNARAGTGKNYSFHEEIIVGWEVIFPGSRECMVYGMCGLRPVYGLVRRDVEGSSSTIEGRRATNDLDRHAIRVGLNFRF